MTQEDRELLLKDLSARLPYGVILLSSNEKITYQTDGNTGAELLVEEEWKPYLRPMSSMTDEEINILCGFIYGIEQVHLETGIKYCTNALDWLNAHHFDYRNLIEKGLAMEAPKGMYK
jgi:hypothetical protein